jgi:hypothetical protein
VSKVTLPPKIWLAYETVLESFRTAVEEAGRQVFFPDRPVASSFTGSGQATVEFKRCLYLRDLPSRQLSGSKRLDVVIMASEELQKGTGEHERELWTLRKSKVQLNYIVVGDGIGKLAQALRFDFDQAGQPDHPFFHVQLNDELIAAGECLTGHVDFEVQIPSERSECCVTTRIPTCDMTLASVLYCVAADHLGGPIFKQFAQKVISLEDRLPPLRFDALKNSIATSPLHFKSVHWFAHMQST